MPTEATAAISAVFAFNDLLLRSLKSTRYRESPGQQSWLAGTHKTHTCARFTGTRKAWIKPSGHDPAAPTTSKAQCLLGSLSSQEPRECPLTRGRMHLLWR